ncbi:MAG: TPR end-of-group domain-containing protein [Vicinamibacteria bacterium]
MKTLLLGLLLSSEVPEARALYDEALLAWKTRTRDGLSESLDLFRKAAAIDPEFAEAQAGVADARLHLSASEPAYALLGDRSEAREMLSTLRDLEASGYVSPLDFAVVHLGLGDTKAALEELERAFETRDASLVYLRTQPGLASLRSEPRFQELLKRMGL